MGNMIFEHINYRSYLKVSLAEKMARNSSYSLRSFAKSLGLAHSTLSLVLKGTKHLSLERSMDVAAKLNLSEKEQEYFSLLVQIESVKDPEKKSAIQDRLNRLRPNIKSYDLNVDKFKVISDWYHFSILSLTRIKDFDFTPSNIASCLDISEIEATVAIERLMRLELLDFKDGKFVEIQDYVLAQSNVSQPAFRVFHRQLLEKAIVALESQKPEEKINGSETFAFNPQDLKEASELTEDYFNKMIQLSERSQQKNGATDVFHLQVNFFNLTPNKKQR